MAWSEYIDPNTGEWWTKDDAGNFIPGRWAAQMNASAPTGQQARVPATTGQAYLPGALDAATSAAQQQYLRDRLAQLELPTLDLQRQGQLFNQGMQQSQMSGYQAPLSRDDALDYIYSKSPYALNQTWNAYDPETRRRNMTAYLSGVPAYFKANPNQAPNEWEQAIMKWAGDPVQVAQAMGAAKAAPTLQREQVQSSQDLALAQLLGYVPGKGPAPRAAEPMASIQPVMDEFAGPLVREPMPINGDPWRAAQASDVGGSSLTLPMRQFLLGQQGQQFGQQFSLRQQTEAERASAAAEARALAQLSGVIGGQETLAARQAREALEEQRLARLGEQGFRQAQLEETRAGRLGQQALQEAGLSGLLGGQETLAARQAREALEEQRLARLGEQGFRQAQLEETRAGRLGQQSFQEAGITGLYGGQQTLAALRQQAELGLGGRAQTLAEQEAARRGGLESAAQALAERRYGLEERGQEQQYGLAGRAQALTEFQAARQNEFTEAGLRGMIGGQETAQARAARLADELARAQLGETREARLAREALEGGALTGSYGGQQTIAGRSLAEQVRAQQAREALEAGQLIGQYDGRDTLEKQRLAKQDQQFYAQLRANLSGPSGWVKYQQLQPQGAFGEMKASPSWESAGGNDFWRMMQGIPSGEQGTNNGIPRQVRQPHKIGQVEAARMTPTQQAMQEGEWSAQGIDPQDAWKRMQASWNTGTAAKTRAWR